MGTDAPRAKRHRGLKALVAVLVALLVLVVIAGGIGVWTVQRSFPTLSGSLDVPGLEHEVTIYRDDAGVPQLVADSAQDLFLAQGFVHAQDRFWEMDFRRHVTSGRLSELFGESQIGTDSFIRTLGWRAIAEKEVQLLEPETLAFYQAYADGVNAYLATRSGAELSLEYAVLGLQNPGYSPEEWTPADSVAWLKAMAWDLRSNLEDEIDRALLSTTLSPEQVAQLHPDYPYAKHPTIVAGPAPQASAPASFSTTQVPPITDPAVVTALHGLKTALASLPELVGPAGGEIGSNSWVAAGSLTDTGLPILANDPHLGPVMPSIWYQVGLHCKTLSPKCPFSVAGYSFSGLPGVIIGHNDRIAWGFTNLGPDVADLYLEKVSGETYELDGIQQPLVQHSETITVAGGDPVTIDILATGHGPIVTGISGDFGEIGADYPAAVGQPSGVYELALQWTALTPGRTAGAIFALNRAQNWDEFREAARLFEVPSQNLLYADVDGNIGYQAPGLIPVRNSGDGTLPVPGWTSAYDWNGFIPFDQLPRLHNPPSGLIVTANNAAVGPDTPGMITKDWDLGYRAQRITALLQEAIGSGARITIDTMDSIQADTFDANAAQIVPVLNGLTIDGDPAKGQELLADWDFHDDVDSPSAAFFNMTWRHLLDAMFADKLPEGTAPAGGDRWFSVVGTLLDQPDSPWWTNEKRGIAGRDAMLEYAMEQAWSEGVERMGRDQKRWSWGRLHTLELTNASFGTSGIGALEWLFNRGPYELGGGSAVVDAVGWDARNGYQADWVPSMRQVISLADFDDSTWVNLTGASGHAFHPNYADQTSLWQTNRTRRWVYGLDTIVETARDSLMLRPTG
ncbi:penicillin acylase family protein [Luethyella okanaganae]|uniref:Penicillin acylase family protein n=1 Tax=Luethyella okanaganae TaxID=69372 RepID=A0ABW1VAQ0_9MICO